MPETTSKAIAKYQIAINKNTSESEILWSRYSALLVFNSLLITAIGFTYLGTIKLPWYIAFFLPIAGLISCYLWHSMTSRGFKWINFWITSANKIEERYLKDKNCSECNPILSGEKHRNEIDVWPKVEHASYFLIKIIGFLYFIFLLYSLNIYFPPKTFHHSNEVRILIHSRDINNTH
jgi:hypothetical protein